MAEVFFVGLKDPKTLRRNILESTKDLVLLVKYYENIKKLRADRTKEVFTLKKTLKEIDLLMNKLKRTLPQTREAPQPKRMPGPRKQPSPLTTPLEDGSRLQELSDQLSELDRKLSEL